MNSKEPFEKHAYEYDAWYESERGKIIYENEKRCIQKLIQSCGRSVEIGVGTGRFAVLLPGSYGVDISTAVLKIAKERGVKVIKAKAEELPFKENTFDCVMLIVTLCFVENPVVVLKEAKRVLKEKGKIIVGAVFLDSLWGKLYEQKKREGHIFYKFAKFYTFQEFQKMVKEAGLKITQIYGTLKGSPFEKIELEEPELITEKEKLSYGFLCVELVK